MAEAQPPNDLMRLLEPTKTKETDSGNICMGDVIAMFSEETKGFVFSDHTGERQNALAAASKQNMANPAILKTNSILFQICPPNRYKMGKKLADFKLTLQGELETATLQSQLSELEQAAQKEEAANEVEQKRQLGKPVSYGQLIQLKHVFSDKYIHANTNETSATEPSNLSIQLLAYNGRSAQFKIIPRYKVKSEGDTVRVNDLITLESAKSQDQFMHISRNTFPAASYFPHLSELNVSAQPSGFTILKSRSEEIDSEKKIRGGSIIQIFHKEVEAYITAEGVLGESLAENVHLRVRPVVPSIPRTLVRTSAAITFWKVEKQNCTYDGGPIGWEEPIRFQHLPTRLFLKVSEDGVVGLTADRKDPMTMFKLFAVVNKGTNVLNDSYVRIQHVETNGWLAESEEPYERFERLHTNVSETHPKIVNWSKAPLKMLRVVETMMYNEAYDIALVKPEIVKQANYCAGVVPFLQHFRDNYSADVEVPTESLREFVEVLEEIGNFMAQNKEPNKLHQKLTRHFRIVDIIIRLLKVTTNNATNPNVAKTIQSACYEWLHKYLSGDSRKNEMYIARNLAFFEEQASSEGIVGEKATAMLTELIKDNLLIIELISEEDIRIFVNCITKKKHHCYLEVLDAICLCNGLAVQDKQTLVSKIWLQEAAAKGQNVLHYLAMGENIGGKEGFVYISQENRKNWVNLNEFCEKNLNTESYKFLVSQLLLFSDISKGRNRHSTNILSKQLELITMELAFECVKDERLPKDLRAVCCSNITDIFVDVMGNFAINDREKLVFIYNNVTDPDVKTRETSVISSVVPIPNLKELKIWISQFLSNNGSLIASDVAMNKFIEQVLVLVHNLADFGYYGDTEDIRKLMTPMLLLMDGRNDLPFRTENTSLPAIKTFRDATRFQKNTQNHWLVRAKYRAMQVVELLFNARFNTRLDRFIQEFKLTLSNPAAELAPFLKNRNDFQDNLAFHRIGGKKMMDIFKETSYFDQRFVDVLKDVMQYDYTEIVTESLLLLNQYYTAFENLFRKCRTAKLVVTEKSLAALNKVEIFLPQLMSLKSNKMTTDNMQQLSDILQALSKLCCLEDDKSQAHPFNQELLYNHGVLNDMLDLIADQKDTKKETDRHSPVIRESLKFLRVLCRKHEESQKRLFGRIDVLLSIKGAEAELGELMIEIFSGNMNNCLRVESTAIHAITGRYLESFHPVWLSLLGCLVLVHGYPIKKNQGVVVKSLMHSQKIMAMITETSFAEKKVVLSGPESDRVLFTKKHRLCSILNLFSLCALGENKTVESMCQCVVQFEEMLELACLPALCYGFKSAFAQYIVWAFMTSTSPSSLSTIEAMAEDPRLFAFIQLICKSLNDAAQLMTEEPQTAAEMLMIRPSNLHRSVTDVNHEKKETLHFACDSAIPFISAFFRVHYGRTVKCETDVVEELARSLVQFASSAHLCVSRSYKRMEIVNTCRIMSVATGMYVAVPKELCRKIEIQSSAKTRYKDYHKGELELNDQFDAFASRVLMAYQGKNTVKFQTGFPSDSPYTVLNSETCLPLGEEFQKLCSIFVRKEKGSKKTFYITPITKHMSVSWNPSVSGEREKRSLELLDVKMLQIVRCLVHNEAVKLPKDRQKDVELYDKVANTIEVTQNTLAKDGVVGAVLPHLSRVDRSIVCEVLNLFNILYKNNNVAPESFVEYVKTTNHEDFFRVVQTRLEIAEGLVKEERFLIGHHKKLLAEMEDLLAAVDGHQKTKEKQNGADVQSVSLWLPKSGRITPQNGDDAGVFQRGGSARRLIHPSQDETSFNADRLKLSNGNLGYIELVMPDLQVDKDVSYITVLLEMLQYLCDLQYTDAQNLCREQVNNAHVVNLVAEVCKFLSVLCSNITQESIRMITESFKALCEMVRGNFVNQAVVFEAKVLDTVHHIIIHENLAGCDVEQVTNLHTEIAFFLLFLTEENQEIDKTKIGSEVIMSAINKGACWNLATKCYNQWNDPKTSTFQATKQQRTAYMGVGFHYFALLKRAIDLSLYSSSENGKSPAWNYYQTNTMSVEIVKDGLLQRAHFRVADQKVMRKEAEERVKWEIDRENPGKKLRDFMAWTKDIAIDIGYQRKIHANLLGSFFVRNWKKFNIAVILMSFGIQLALLIYWDSVGPNDKVPQFKPEGYDKFHEVIMHGFGTVHTVLSFCMFISFFLSNMSGFASWIKKMKVLFANFKNKLKDGQAEKLRYRSSKLEVGLFSTDSLYYMVIMGMSVAGAVISPAFFAFHMLQISENNELISRVIKAVTKNGRSLLWVSVLGLIIIYIFALIGFLIYRDDITSNYLFCTTLWQCTLTLIREGFIYRLTRLEAQKGTSFSYYAAKLLWDIGFFAIILTIGLNVIFGIIVDTFRQLRDEKWKTEQEILTRCFICSRNSYEFEQKGISFNYHLHNEHNHLAYIFFFVKMDDTANNHLTALEMYMLDMIKVENYNFFPVGRSLSIDGVFVKDERLERDTQMMSQLNGIMENLREEIEFDLMMERNFVAGKTDLRRKSKPKNPQLAEQQVEIERSARRFEDAIRRRESGRDSPAQSDYYRNAVGHSQQQRP